MSPVAASGSGGRRLHAGGGRPLALWATPRSTSTAFDRMMRERGDHQVLTEPFSYAYYHGPERVSSRYPASMPDRGYSTVLAAVLEAAASGPVFVKDMAYHLGPRLDVELLDCFTNTFLVRDPARALPSLARIWPDFTDDEAGYRPLRRAFELCCERDGTVPPVLDATELCAAPQGFVAAWCAAVGIEHRPEALAWEPGMPEAWEPWAKWFEGTAATTGFSPPAATPPTIDDPTLLARIAACRDDYEAVHRHRLRHAPDT